MAEIVRIKGLRELQRAFRAADPEVARELTRELRQIGKPIEGDARSRLSGYSAKSAAGIRARVRGGTTLVVEQRRRRTTGKRGDWGKLQMRKALLPARAAHAPRELERNLEQMLDRLAVRHGF